MSIIASILEYLQPVATVVCELLVLFAKIVFLVGKSFVKIIGPGKELKDEIVLITGSAQGFGKQLAKDIAKQGAKVVLWDINENGVKNAAEEIASEGGKVWYYVCDVTSEKEVQAKAEEVAKDVGDVTILVNNAGILSNVPFLELESEKIKRTFAVNILAHIWTIRAFLPKMMEHNYGHIVAIASAAGLLGQINQSDYSATKFAVVGLMESLSEEMRVKKCKVAFTTICPVTMDTGMNRHPVSRCPILAPILNIEDAARFAVGAIKREEFLVTIPRKFSFLLGILKLLPHEVTLEFKELVDYCRISNAVPRADETEAK